MKNSKVTKRALFSSVMSSSLCVSMLIGTTFAWFTDTASTKVNTIQAGNLDVTLEYYDGKGNPADSAWKNAENEALFNSDKWEPGHMVVQGLRVGNAGNLSLNWKATLGTKTGISELGDVIDVYVKPGEYTKPTSRTQVTEEWDHVGTLTDFVSKLETTTNGSLKAGKKAELGIALVMQTTAGNEYQNLSLGDNLSLNILATQSTGESDSFNNEYDKNALFTPEAAAVYYVTPDNAQTTIDNAVDNSVVILQKGDYSKLFLGQEKRTINNLTIIAEDGVTVEGIEAVVEPVTGNEQLKINNLTLQGIDFIKEGVFFDLRNGTPWISVDGFTMTDCSYDGTNYVVSNPDNNEPGNRLFDIGTDSPGSHQFKNVLIESSKVMNAQQGIRIGGVTDITVRDCTFETIDHNAITLRSVSGGINRIEDNTINNGKDRAFRVGTNNGGTIIYKNNVITKTGDTIDGSNFKVTTNTGDIQFIGNTVDGEKWDGN